MTSAPPALNDSGPRTNWAFWLLVAIYFGVTFSVSLGYSRYHADEWYYTNGALRMLDTGNYLTPRNANDKKCFSKPPHTAWLVLAAFKIFGIAIWSARLPFILAGCAILWITHRLAWLLFRRKDVALLAAAILASSHVFIILTGGSITDWVFALGLLLSHFGFMRIIFLGERGTGAYACAYLGCGFAVGIRGLLGFTPLFFAFLFAWWKSKGDLRFSHLLKPALILAGATGIYACAFRVAGRAPAIGSFLAAAGLSLIWLRKDILAPRYLINPAMVLAGALLGLGWLIPALCLPRHTFLEELWWDQGGSRFHDSCLLTNLWYYPCTLMLEFLPWEIPLALCLFRARQAGGGGSQPANGSSQDARGLAAGFKHHQAVFYYLLGWCALVMTMYLPGNLTRVRYLAACFPLFSVFLAAWLFETAKPIWLEKAWKILVGAAAGVCCLGGALLAAWGRELHPNVAQGGMFLAAAALIFGLLLVRSRIPAAVLLSVFAILLFALFDVYGRGWTLPFPEEQIARTMASLPDCTEAVVLAKNIHMEDPHKVAARLRVCTANRITFSILEAPRINATLPSFIVFKQIPDMPELKLENYQLLDVAKSVNIKDFWGLYSAWREGRLQEYLASCTETWFVAVRTNTNGNNTHP